MPTSRSSIARASTILFCLSVALTSTRAGASYRGNVPEASSSSCLVLQWMDPHELFPVGTEWVAEETLHVLERADIGARWEWPERESHVRDAVSTEREHHLRVVLIPSEPAGPGWRLAPSTLGVTMVDDHGRDATPAVYIFYNALVATLGKADGLDRWQVVRRSRALGRVVAHEIAHAIAPREPHATDGLMRANLEMGFLTARREVTFDARWKRLLGKGMSELCSTP